MKYTLIDEKGQYALILRGENMTQYAVVSGLDKKTGGWDWTCCYIDHMSGKNTNRPELQRMMEYVRRGDTVIVESISRFARNTRDLLELVERLTAKGVDFVSKKEAIDTTTPTGKFMLTIFGAVAELEREYTLQRQREGIAIAKEQGKYTGRKTTQPPNFDRVVAQWHRGEITAVEAMKILKMSKTTFYRKVKALSLDVVK